MEKIINIAMNFLYRNKDDMDEEKAEIIKYGLELLFIKIIFFAATMVIGLFMHSFWQCIIFTTFFSKIRSFAGGYHANSRIQCFVQSMITFVTVLIILKLVKLYVMILIPVSILSIISSIIIFCFAPVDTENKRIDDEEFRIFKVKSRITMLIEIALAIIAYFIRFQSISCSVMLALIVTAILISIEIIKRRVKCEQ